MSIRDMAFLRSIDTCTFAEPRNDVMQIVRHFPGEEIISNIPLWIKIHNHAIEMRDWIEKVYYLYLKKPTAFSISIYDQCRSQGWISERQKARVLLELGKVMNERS
jgi:hypothetical protein